MQTLLEVGLSNALAACVPAVAALLAGLCRRRPALVHALWLLVLVKLITPPAFRVDLPWPAAVPAAPTGHVEDPPPEAEAPAELGPPPAPEPADGAAPEAGAAVAAEPAPPALPAPPPESPPMAPEPDWPALLACVWLLGSLGWCALALKRAREFSRALRYAAPAPDTLLIRVEELSRLVGLPGRPEVRLLPGRLAPMVWGVWRPVLLLPEGLLERVGAEGLDTLILHELAHVRRRDHWVRALELAAVGLFWWHPLAWYARRELRQAEEQCCDAHVVRALPGAARAYAVALVDALDFLSEAAPPVPPLACGIGEVADLKRRLKMILGRCTPHTLGWAAGLAVLGLAAVLLPLLPAVGRGQADVKPGGSGAKNADATLEQLELELKRRMDEIAQLKRKAEDIKKARDEQRAREEVEKEREKARAKGKAVVVGGVKEWKGGAVIRIEISGLDGKAEDLEKLAKALEQALPGKERKVIVLRAGGQGHGFNFHVPPPAAPMHPAPPALAKPVQPPAVGDRRIDGLEKKLDGILRELEALRRELKGHGKGGMPPGGGGNMGPGPGGPMPK